MDPDLAEFLRGRYRMLADRADRAARWAPSPWIGTFKQVTSEPRPGHVQVVADTRASEISHHVELWDPDAVRADLRSKLLVLAEHEHTAVKGHMIGPHSFGCRKCHDYDGDTMGDGWCTTIRALAVPFAQYPEFHPDWRLEQ